MKPSAVRPRQLVVAGTVLAVVLGTIASGDTVRPLTTFQPGQILRSSDINANFAEVKRAVDDNSSRIGDLASLQTNARGSIVDAVNEVSGLSNRLAALETRVTTLEGRVSSLEARRQFMTYSPTTFPDIIIGPSAGANVDIVLRQFDGVRHLSTTVGDLNAIHAFADAPGVITIAGATLDGNRNLNPIPGGGGKLALDVVVHYDNSSGVNTFTTVSTLQLGLPAGASGTQRFTLTLPSLRAAAPADATSLLEVTVRLNAGASTLAAGGLGAIRCTAFVPLSQ